jgi:GntR family transcriptional regulator
MIDPRGPVPAYLQVADVIAARIAAGQLEVDKPIPSEESMRQEFGVARGTIRRAVQELRERGLVYTVAQRGSYVKGR